MAAFPAALTPSPESSVTPNRGIETYVTEGGGIRGRVKYPVSIYSLSLVYPDLTDAERLLITNHFTAGPTDPHTVDVRGVTYNVTYAAEPADVEYHGALRTVQVDFIGTKA